MGDYGNLTDYEPIGLDLEALYAHMRNYPNVIILTVALGILFLIGTIGNILVVVVFARSFVKHNSTYLILTLAVVDLLINLINIPGVLLREWYIPFRIDIVCKLWEMFQMATIPISALILVAIAFDRYFLICKAFEGPISTFWSRLFVVAAIVIGFILGIPPMLAVGVYNYEYHGLCQPNFLIIDKQTLDNYWKFLTSLFVLIIIILTTLYVFIFLKVYKQSKKWNGVRKNKIIPNQKKNKQDKSCTEEIRDPLGNVVGHKHPRIKFHRFERFKRFFGCHDGDESKLFENKNNVFLVNVTPIRNQETTITENQDREYTAIEQLTPESCSKNKNVKTIKKPAKKVKNKSSAQYQEKNHRQKKAHIKTAKVLCIVTIIYIVSYLPTFVITHSPIHNNIFLFYFYFIHSASNPVIYSFMNKQFRNEIKKLFKITK
ncbi:hypothetical protein SNE40_003647 [Patella caerulea]|uniref:G-protein coupled receptors family 1 profile domain-containing protein n=1 Tax=Patella caerulea TaxID=87958 RepID=A0AAN8Q113_PATCE